MRRQYFVWYFKNFGNTYKLYYVDEPDELDRLPEGAEQISFEKAEELARAETWRRKEDPSFAYYADEYVYPADDEGNGIPCNENLNYRLRGRVWEKVKR